MVTEIDVNCHLQANGKQMLTRRKLWCTQYSSRSFRLLCRAVISAGSRVTVQGRKGLCVTLSFTDSGIFETRHLHTFITDGLFCLNETIFRTGSRVTAGSIAHRFRLCTCNCSSSGLSVFSSNLRSLNRVQLRNRKALNALNTTVTSCATNDLVKNTSYQI